MTDTNREFLDNIDKEEIKRLCNRCNVKKLSFFGSVTDNSFSEDSDVDVLVNFNKGKEYDLFSLYFDLKEGLEELFKRPVDLVVDKDFSNPYFKEEVEKSREKIYES